MLFRHAQSGQKLRHFVMGMFRRLRIPQAGAGIEATKLLERGVVLEDAGVSEGLGDRQRVQRNFAGVLADQEGLTVCREDLLRDWVGFIRRLSFRARDSGRRCCADHLR